MNDENITLSTSKMCRQWLYTGQSSSNKRVGDVVQILSELQLGDHHHGLWDLVRQCSQTLQGVVLGLVVLHIAVLVT